MLQEHEGDLSFATDGWTSPNHKAFVAITVHFEVDGVPIRMLLDLVEVAESHSGVNLAAAFAGVLDEFGIADKVSISESYLGSGLALTRVGQILSITCDNASPNDTMINQLEIDIEKFRGGSTHTRCFNHVLAIGAVRIVRQFDIPKGGDEGVLDEAEQALRELAEGLDLEEMITQRERDIDGEDEDLDDDLDDWIHERACMTAIDREDLDESLRPVRMLLVKVSPSFYHTQLRLTGLT